jgi:WD40 repeat protein
MAYLSSGSFLATVSPDSVFPRLWSALSTPTVYFLTKDYGVDSDTSGTFTSGFGLCPWSHCDAVQALAAKSDGTTLATGSNDNSIIFWDPATKNRVGQLTSHTDYVTSLVWMDTETKIASGSKDGDIRIWDATTVAADQSSSAQTLTGHSPNQVNAIAFFSTIADGQLASGDAAGNVKLWDCN